MRRYPVWSYFAATAAMLCVLIALFLTAFRLTVFDRGFIDREMRKFHVAESVGMSQDGLMDLYDEVLKYLEGKRFDLELTVERNGQRVEAFHERELLHMVDVEALFRAGFRLLYAACGIGAALILLLCLWKHNGRRIWKVMLRGFLAASGIFFAALAVVALAIVIDFDHTFILFHQIFFTNDLWQLDYRTDLLMNIVPETFSYDVAVRTILYFAAVFVPLLIAGAVGFWRDRVRIRAEKA